MKQKLVIWGLLLGVLAALAAALFERVPVQSPPVWSEEARRNPLLAGGRLLERRGWRVDYLAAAGGPPPGRGVLFLRYDASTLPPEALPSLLAWVHRGNRLILPARYLGDPENGVRDALLEPLEVFLHDRELEEGEVADPEGREYSRRLAVDGGRHWLHTDFSPRFHLEDAAGKADQALADAAGIHVLRYPVGRGEIHVLSDTALFSSPELARHDNAALWLRLFGAPGADQRAWLVYGGESPGILQLVWRQAPEAVISLLCLLLVLVWHGNSRFGPLLPSPQAPRRRLGEHLLAAGRYHWYNGARDRLYLSARQRLRHHLLRRRPHWRALPEAELARELEHHTGIEAARLLQALNGPPHSDPARFLQDMRTLHQIRKQT